MDQIDTERLVLRGHRIDDFDDCVAMWADPEVTRHVGGRPSTVEETWTRLLRYLGHWSVMGYGFWTIRDRATDRFIGEVGFADFKRDVEPALGAPEIGWALASHAHGRGLATEAVKAVVAWGDARWDRTACMIDLGNLASVRVAEKCGYVQVAPAIYKGQPTILYERVRRSAVP